MSVSVRPWSVVALALTSSACLSDINWADLPDAPGPVRTGSGGRGGSGGLTGSGGTGHGQAGASAGAGSVSPSGADAGGVSAADGGVLEPAPACSATESCLSLSQQSLPPSPCAGVRYSQAIGVTGGTAPYHWSLGDGSTSEFALRPIGSGGDGATVRVESTAPGGPTRGGPLSVVVEDASVPPARLAFDLDLGVRESCWFAYLSEASTRELHLRDVFLENDVVLGAALDFEFSPDGTWLAFRRRTAEGDRLYTYRARAPRSTEAEAVTLACPGAPLEAEAEAEADAGAAAAAACDVLDYAWSDDSDQLAFVVGGSDPAQDFISGRSGFAGAAPGAPWPWMGRASWVADDVPLDYREQLAWLDRDRIMFLGEELSSDSATQTVAPYVASVARGGGGSAPPDGIPPLLTEPGALLRRAANGLAVIAPAADSESSTVGFFAPGDTNMRHSGWLSPSGSFVGLATDVGELELYDVHDADDPVASSEDVATSPPAAHAGCAAIVAWSDPIGPTGRERLACTVGADLEFFEYDPTTERLEHLARVRTELAAGVRRAFSPEGRWFTFGKADGASFWIIDLDAAMPRVNPTPIVLGRSPVELAYPPARAGLVTLSDAAGVAEYPLPGASSRGSAFTSAGRSARSPCVEAFWMSPADWCGAPRAARHLAYAPDSKSLLFESATGQLSLAQPGVDADAQRISDGLAACSGACAARPFAFQPDLAREPDR